MKRVRTISVFLVMLLVVCAYSFSFSEPFEIRNGIQFGMSSWSVIKAEEKNGNTINSVMTDKEGVDFIEFYGEIASYDNCKVGYYFLDNQLKLIRYRWEVELKKSDLTQQKEKEERENILSQYNSFLTVLESKYNKIGYIGDNGVVYTDFSREGVPSRLKENYDFLIDTQYTKCIGFSQFLVEDINGFVEIHLYLTEFNSINGYRVYELGIEYRFIEPETIEAINNSQMKKEEKMNSDL